MNDMSRRHRIMSVLWSAFLMAGVLEMVVFALVDPESLRWFGGESLGLASRAVYTLAFFLFWAVIAAGGALAMWLCSSAGQVDRDGRTSARLR